MAAVKVRDTISAQELYDATIGFLDLMRASRVLYDDPQQARREALNSVEVFLNALVAREHAA